MELIMLVISPPLSLSLSPGMHADESRPGLGGTFVYQKGKWHSWSYWFFAEKVKKTFLLESCKNNLVFKVFLAESLMNSNCVKRATSAVIPLALNCKF